MRAEGTSFEAKQKKRWARIFVGALFLFLVPVAIFAATFVDNTEGEFNSGSYSDAQWDTDHIELTDGSLSGDFTSQVFDGGASGDAIWNTLSWSESLPSYSGTMLALDANARVFGSVDQGSGWTQIHDDYNGADGDGSTDGVTFTSDDYAYVLRDEDVWRTTDSGASWTKVNDAYGGSTGREIVAGSDDDLFIADSGEDLWRSQDDGSTWIQRDNNFNGGGGDILGMAAVGNDLYAVDTKADVWKSVDDGATWATTNTNYNGGDTDNGTDHMSSNSSGHLFIAHNAKVWRSIDSGVNWTERIADFNGGDANTASTMAVDDNDYLYIADSSEDIWRSTDSGATWTLRASNINGTGGDVIALGFLELAVTTDVKFQARSGASSPPGGNFIGPGGGTGDYYSTPGGNALGDIGDARYFQYKAFFTSTGPALTPEVSSVTVDYTAQDDTPPVISNVASSTPSGTTATITWDTDENATSRVEYGLTAAYGSTTTVDPTLELNHSVGLSSLSDNTTYHYRVISLDADGNEAVSGDYTFTTPDETPPVISNEAANPTSETTATITWDTDEGATTQVLYGTSPGVYPFSSALEGSYVTDHTSLLSGLTAETTYYYVVQSTDSSGNTATSGELSFITPDETPPVISNETAGAITDSTATITWDTDEGATSQVSCGTSPGTYTFSSTFDGSFVTSHAASLSGLDPNTTYYCAVTSEDDSGNSSTSSEFSFTTLEDAGDTTPPVISNVRVLSVDGTSATIAWDTNEPATSEVLYGLTAAYGFSSGVVATLVDAHTIVISGLVPGTTYHYQVASNDADGNPASSGDFTFETPAEDEEDEDDGDDGDDDDEERDDDGDGVPDPLAISGVSVSVDARSASLSWSTNLPASCRVDIGTSSGRYARSVSTSRSESHGASLGDLDPRTTYFYLITCRRNGEEVTFGEATFRTPAPAPAPPGSPGTTDPIQTPGATETETPIEETPGDDTPPIIVLDPVGENPTKDQTPTFTGVVTDEDGVIESISISLDGGLTWHALSSVTGIGTSRLTFTFLAPFLKDGNYDILVRAYDNSENVAFSRVLTLVVDLLPPTFGGKSILKLNRPAALFEDGSYTTIAGTDDTLALSAEGGPIEVQVQATPKDGGSTEKFDLEHRRGLDLWVGDFEYENDSTYDVELYGIDGAGNETTRPINNMVVEPSGRSLDEDSSEPLSGAMVTLYTKDMFDQWRPWQGDAYLQQNSQTTSESGWYYFVVPPGTYYVDVHKSGYQRTLSQIIELDYGGPVSGDVRVPPRPGFSIGSLDVGLPSWFVFAQSVEVSSSAITQQAAGLPFEGFIDEQMPQLVLKDSDGIERSLESDRGKPVLLTLWNSWDSRSQEQLHALERVKENVGDRAAVWPLTLQESESAANTYLRRGNYDLVSLVDPYGVSEVDYPVLTMPQHIFLDRDGVVRDVQMGLMTTEDLEQKLSDL